MGGLNLPPKSYTSDVRRECKKRQFGFLKISKLIL
ncbi:unnamed protein product [Leptidea sinapis]|uniref:Uncharacterized protein n=1 Tax=Leptidea sinapis TaxID=189913 RepID=A0A5E4PQ12_9NEOP|nr:unnamed protein product [Leptidea sinapis]